MSSALQNRLVGTIILVALVVIFLPNLLDGEKQSNQQTFIDVPESEAAPVLIQPKPFPTQEIIDTTRKPLEVVQESEVTDSSESIENVDDISSESSVSEAVENIVEQSETLQQQTIVEKEDELDAGWVVQLGSFRYQKNVRELLDKLQAAGYRAFSKKVETSAGMLTKVFVGPELEQEKLEDALSHLNEVTGLKGKVTSFKEATN